MDEDHHVKTKNAVLINSTLIKKLQSINIIDEDNLSNCSSTPSVQAGIEIVGKSSGFYLNFG